ncbi:MAG: DUF1080 domain-containing protein [Gimesia sp.]|nr:DUF1080 domain-containing protein [Gimesia sp.]
MARYSLLLLLLANAAPLFGAEDFTIHQFERLQLGKTFYAEGATFGDVNRDGHQDVISGPYWHEGPEFKTKHEFYPVKEWSINGYSDNFFAYVHDVNNDKWLDIVILGFPGKEGFWYANPQNKTGHWKKHLAHPAVDNESPTYADLTGDGEPELVFHTGGQLGYAGPGKDPTQPWSFHAISPNLKYGRFTHGLGVGDVNGDGKPDILEKNGWWEQPSNLSKPGFWTRHPVKFSAAGGAQMYAYDVDGDGDQDVITSKAAHAYGLSWFENVKRDGEITFVEHKIMGSRQEENKYGVVFSQLHAVALEDMDGDGVKDIITGKRFWAHQGHDPGAKEPPVNYWFKTVRTKKGVDFLPYQINDQSGVGTQVVVGDVTGDKLPDVVVGNKSGAYLLVHKKVKVDEETWKKAQPEKFVPKKVSLKNELKPGEFFATNADGKRVNVDFELGNLKDWISEGEAFKRQPARGDTVYSRRSDMRSHHQGQFWVGTYEFLEDNPVGTLTSAAIKVTQPFASFYVGGGSHESTRVEIVDRATNKVIAKASGRNHERMHQTLVDLKKYQGKEIFIRLVDQHSGSWGHINFDHFRFHEKKPAGLELVSSGAPPKTHSQKYDGLPGPKAAEVMTVPDGFSVSLIAAEPDVQQPIAMTIDDRGRLWVAESYAYPSRQPEGKGKDRILIFEDKDADGKFETRKIFKEKLNLVSGLEVGFGGVWVGQAPYLLFIPDKNGDDVPDAAPEVLLDGWHYEDTHETLNSFIWGPDGWLYGCHGVFTHSRVGKPGTPDKERQPINAGIWRYHPTRHEFEIFAHGTSNPWGVDFNDQGQCFLTCCVIPHLFHVAQNARYRRQAGQHFNPYTYDDIKTIARHRHWTGGQWNQSDRVASDRVGGGHAHAGAMIYLGGSWPEKYRNQLFMNNIHGARLNQDVLTRQGSGYAGDFAPDFLFANDRSSQILYLRTGPDGQVYFIDWYDTNQCHHREYQKHDRSNGRIFRVAYKNAKPVQVDLKKLTSAELVKLQLHKNDWYVRQSRRILQERGADPEVYAQLSEISFHHADVTRRLRGLWALHVTGGLSEQKIMQALKDPSEYMRGWAIQLALETGTPSAALLSKLAQLASQDPSPVVRLYLGSAANRLPLDQRWEILTGLVGHAEDQSDHNLPLLYWYAVEPLASHNMQRSFELASNSRIPLIESYTLRRIADIDTEEAVAFLVQQLGQAKTAARQKVFLDSINSALRGRRKFPMPEAWSVVGQKLISSSDPVVKSQSLSLAVTFGDPEAMQQLREIVRDQKSKLTGRKSALASLLGVQDPKLVSILIPLLDEKGLRREALRGLAGYTDAAVAPSILERYQQFDLNEKRDALNTLASRADYAHQLLAAIESQEISAKDLSAEIVRQLGNLKDKSLNQKIGKVWGIVRESAADKKKLIAVYKRMISRPRPKPDLHLGRAVFTKTCQQCHKLFGTGQTIGPELTGSNRANLDYLLSNVIDPSAVMAKDYQPVVIVTESGRIVTGIIKKQDQNAVTVATANETVIIPRAEIDEMSLSDKSMMPDNLWKQLSSGEVRSLVAYLASGKQVPMQATKDNLKLFFNGQNLTGWTGNSQLWSVENGEIVGRSPGIKSNEFLVSDMLVGDFELKAKIKLSPNSGNSGIQFRSRLEPNGHVKGYQADAGKGWWGKLYEELGRGLLFKKSGEEYVRENDWNEYRIVAVGPRIRTYINGNLCADLNDPQGAKSGIIAFQLHSGGPMEVRFKDLELRLGPDID